jgi:hypothetical protein
VKVFRARPLGQLRHLAGEGGSFQDSSTGTVACCRRGGSPASVDFALCVDDASGEHDAPERRSTGGAVSRAALAIRGYPPGMDRTVRAVQAWEALDDLPDDAASMSNVASSSTRNRRPSHPTSLPGVPLTRCPWAALFRRTDHATTAARSNASRHRSRAVARTGSASSSRIAHHFGISDERLVGSAGSLTGPRAAVQLGSCAPCPRRGGGRATAGSSAPV